MNGLQFLSLGSGSSGNCYYFGHAKRGILIDAGLAARSIRNGLKAHGIDFSQLDGVVVSHDHYDHIKALGVLGENYHIPIYTTRSIHEGIDRNWGVTQKLNGSRKYIEVDTPFEVGSFRLTAFHVSHDASENVGFWVECGARRFLVATDLGCSNPQLEAYLREAELVVLEANYDFELLQKGKYPYPLKQRIIGDTGHLDNSETARLLSETWNVHRSHVFLCHLSRDNNTPALALETVRNRLIEDGHNLRQLQRLEPLCRGVHCLIDF
ncbi:MAG: MBL fold metallo-hydrolase [Bacteroidales bacterium]|jgi:phosphoribosyl 1,2-cyclic phosphodiesterase|nr:MBL fold metallo-hydrolase [Bacteroidales bacterium]MDD4770705.1 MBL fold metallo-hydrolase [Bacteroidales bacterium]HKL92207.1 MBL fold metallo-hydrolase [Bacteroidales bacterium]